MSDDKPLAFGNAPRTRLRRAEIIEQLQSGQIRFIISTEPLEAGIDLP